MKGFLLPIYTTIIIAIIAIVIIMIAFVGYMFLFLDKDQYQYSFIFETNNAYYFANMLIQYKIGNHSVLDYAFKTSLTGEDPRISSLLASFSDKYKTTSLFFSGKLFNVKISNETEDVYYFKNREKLVKCKATYNGVVRDGFCSPKREYKIISKVYPGPQHNQWKEEKIDGRFFCGVGRLAVNADVMPCEDPEMWCCIDVHSNEYKQEMGITAVACGNGGVCDFRGCSYNRVVIEDKTGICNNVNNGLTPSCCAESEAEELLAKKISTASIPFLFKNRIGFLDIELGW